MTREEAIAFFKDMNECTYDNTEAIKMAIQALEQQANTELIIKTTIKEYLDKFYLSTNDLLIDLNHDLCKRIRCREVEE